MKFSGVYVDKDNIFNGGIHAGTLVIHRDHSKEALALWRQQVSLIHF